MTNDNGVISMDDHEACRHRSRVKEEYFVLYVKCPEFLADINQTLCVTNGNSVIYANDNETFFFVTGTELRQKHYFGLHV